MLAALCWWTYLLYSKNELIYTHEYTILELKNELTPALKAELENQHKGQRGMIIAEGIVFGLAVSMGVFYLYAFYKKDIKNTQKQNNFLLSVTHELKSPLASMKLAFETIKKRALKPNQYQEISSHGIEEADRLHGIIENILTATKIDQKYTVQRSTIDLQRIQTGLQKIWQHDSVRDRIEFKLKGDPNQSFEADSTGIKHIIVNYVENALKYSEEKIIVHIELRKKHLYIAVEDFGPGIPAEERKLIFNRFYRIGNEETRKSKGTGLGLYIVEQIAQLNKGKVNILPNKPQGSIFTAELEIII